MRAGERGSDCRGGHGALFGAYQHASEAACLLLLETAPCSVCAPPKAAPEPLLECAGTNCPGNSTLDRAAAYASAKRSPRWEHVRELATDPYFSIHHAALKRYASTQSPRFVENDDIVIILMASEQRADRARMQRETWLRNYPHLFIVGDAEDPSVPMITLPELEGRASYADAQHRQLRYMRFLYEHRPDLLDKRYFFLVGASCRGHWRTARGRTPCLWVS